VPTPLIDMPVKPAVMKRCLAGNAERLLA